MNLSDPIFTDEAKARTYFEELRWPKGAVCPHCGEAEKVYRLEGKSHRPGLFHCNSCNGAFTVTTGSVMESSHLPLNKWALGFRLFAASKKGFSAHQLHRMLGITYKSAWFMAHRIREAMKETDATPMGGEGKIVEVDETYMGKPGMAFRPGKGWQKNGPRDEMKAIVSLVERGGRARSIKVETLDHKTLDLLMIQNASRYSRLMTDEANRYKHIGKQYKSHETVNHSAKVYAYDDVTTNTVEGFFSIFKRGMRGVYQHCGDRHLPRYLAEFDFRYSNRIALGIDDVERTAKAIKAAEGKRLTYQQSSGARAAQA